MQDLIRRKIQQLMDWYENDEITYQEYLQLIKLMTGKEN